MPSELESYLERIEDLRGQVRALVADLPAEALNWRPLPVEAGEVNSLAVLAAHIAGAEHFWIAEVIGGGPATRDRDAEFVTTAVAADELVRLLDAVGVETRQVFASLTPDDLNGERQARGRDGIPVRWSILHIIDHTALHLGHMQLTVQLWNGGQGVEAPFWYERLKGERIHRR
jgi:uncharacterized damage-inducible protein DinB